MRRIPLALRALTEAELGVQIAPKPSRNFKYEITLTLDEDTPGYTSAFVFMETQPQWGFHVVWVELEGVTRSSSAAHKVNLRGLQPAEYGKKFLKTFELVLERTSKVRGLLGQTRLLQGHPKWDPKDMLNVLLMDVYSKMWDLDVDIAPFKDIPKDVIDEFHAFVDQEFGDD